jgi:hypothetical protein
MSCTLSVIIFTETNLLAFLKSFYAVIDIKAKIGVPADVARRSS